MFYKCINFYVSSGLLNIIICVKIIFDLIERDNMPSYKTHSIHGEVILPYIDKKIEINKDDIKTFCIGPDTMIVTDYKLFDHQHSSKTKEYFETLLKLVKKNKLQDNSEVMAFIYGQIDHYILDTIMHPYIYYTTENLPKNNVMLPHSLIEMWIDDYISKKLNIKDKKYYHKLKLSSHILKNLINNLYSNVYNKSLAYLKYKYGLTLIKLFDSNIRKNSIKVAPFLTKILNIGDITYHENLDHVLPYLNINNDIWYDPETGEKNNDSFYDLWRKSIEVSLETIDDINKYLYCDKKINNQYIVNNISYNTGLPCEKGQSFQYIKKY